MAKKKPLNQLDAKRWEKHAERKKEILAFQEEHAKIEKEEEEYQNRVLDRQTKQSKPKAFSRKLTDEEQEKFDKGLLRARGRNILEPTFKSVLKEEEEELKQRQDERVASADVWKYIEPASRGMLVVDSGETKDITQRDLRRSVNVLTASKMFNLDLPDTGPYNIDYDMSGRHLLMGSMRGHMALVNWGDKKLIQELQLDEPIHAVQFFHNETMWACAAEEKVGIYNAGGIQITKLKTKGIRQMSFLPYHFLLVTSSPNRKIIEYRDVSLGGKVVMETTNKTLNTSCMKVNPYNALIGVGTKSGTVCTWSPNSNVPIEQLFAHRGTIRGLEYSRDGMQMVTGGDDGMVRVWDVRKIDKPMSEMELAKTRIIKSMHLSATGLLALSYDDFVQVYDNVLTGHTDITKPYMQHRLKKKQQVQQIRFTPFEDILGIGHSGGYSSIVIPGSGEAKVDTSEVNLFGNIRSRNQKEVQMLLEKIPYEMIISDPKLIGAAFFNAADKTKEELNASTGQPNQKKKTAKVAGAKKVEGKKESQYWANKREHLRETQKRKRDEREEVERELRGEAGEAVVEEKKPWSPFNRFSDKKQKLEKLVTLPDPKKEGKKGGKKGGEKRGKKEGKKAGKKGGEKAGEKAGEKQEEK
ncbi:hypothetical protein PROFUN_06198 [Planoprotostelium fungivorum]|uniref:BING4 C-terminal domain-containing protein n=1 Tax=Planoprotostelium fungivorum TaxID=1890364 RepID=A0A2P6MYZ0_9EUKA|nr:hypothetical protein PROFUN_06198 [Planoprotostelium fungivorum]